MNCLMTSPQAPPRGNRRASSGNALSTKYGNAIPTPTIMISATPTAAGWVSAHARSPTNIPNVQGVDSAAVRTPNRKLPTYVSCLGVTLYSAVGTFTVNIPNMLIAIATSTTTIGTMNHHLVNSPPQSITRSAT